MTIHELAEKSGLKERYLREWASSMVASEYLAYDPTSRRISMSPEQAMVLAQENSPVFVGGMAQMIPDHYRILPKIIEAFHRGGGVPYTEFSEDTFEGTERLFRPGYINFMAQQWMPAMPDVFEKLQRGAKVAGVERRFCKWHKPSRIANSSAGIISRQLSNMLEKKPGKAGWRSESRSRCEAQPICRKAATLT